GVLEDLLVSLGLFVKEGTTYYFSHKTFQEYFTAVHISKLPNDTKLQVYNKLYPPERFGENLFQHLNMLEILREIDYLDFTLNFSLPYLNKIFKNSNYIKNDKNIYERNLTIMFTLVRRILD